MRGYYYPDDPNKKSERTCSTISLIRDGNFNIISDPGSMTDPGNLIDKLEESGLTPVDINLAFISHAHPDHYRYLGLFPKARVLDYWGLWDGDRCHMGIRFVNENIYAVKTPGHSFDSITLLVHTGQGKFAICGDVFWEKDFFGKDPYASDPIALEKSRKWVLEWADFIVPGHGDMFKTG